MTTTTFINIAQVNFFFASAIEEFFLVLASSSFQGVSRENQNARLLLQHAIIIRTLTIPATDRTLADADFLIGNQFVRTEMAAGTQTITDRAGTEGIVK